MLAASELERRGFDGYVLYGDEGYPYSEHMAAPFRTPPRVREAARIQRLDGRRARQRGMRTSCASRGCLPSCRSPIAQFHRGAVLLANMVTSLSAASQAAGRPCLPAELP
jgi:hypothetical protein